MKLITTSILVSLFATTAFAQSRSLVVCDSLSKNPLPYVAVYAGDKSMLTNEEGRFTCRVGDSLFVALPFKNRRQYISATAIKHDTILINAAIHLEPITIVDAKSIFEKVLENVPRNYNTSRYCNFNSFIRTTTTHNGKYIHFQEIATRSYSPFEMPLLGNNPGGFGAVIKGLRNSSMVTKEYQINTFHLLQCLGRLLAIDLFPSYHLEAVESYADGWKFSFDLSHNDVQYKGWFLVNKEYAVTEFFNSIIPKQVDTYQKNKIKQFSLEETHFFYEKQRGSPYYSKKYFKLYQKYFLSDSKKTKVDTLVAVIDAFNYGYQYDNLEKITPSKKVLLTPLNRLKFPYEKSFWDTYKVMDLSSAQKKQLAELEEKKPFQD